MKQTTWNAHDKGGCLLYALVIAAVIAAGCARKPENKTCNIDSQMPEHFAMFTHGELFTDKPNFRTIVYITNKYDWDYNLHFYGEGFSSNEEDALKVPEKDSCDLMALFLKWRSENPHFMEAGYNTITKGYFKGYGDTVSYKLKRYPKYIFEGNSTQKYYHLDSSKVTRIDPKSVRIDTNSYQLHKGPQ